MTEASKEPHREVISDLIESLSALVPHLLLGMKCHREIPSLQYYGLLNLRLLFRLPFFKPNQLEELLSEGSGDGDDSDMGGVDGIGGTMSISGGPSILGKLKA